MFKRKPSLALAVVYVVVFVCGARSLCSGWVIKDEVGGAGGWGPATRSKRRRTSWQRCVKDRSEAVQRNL